MSAAGRTRSGPAPDGEPESRPPPPPFAGSAAAARTATPEDGRPLPDRWPFVDRRSGTDRRLRRTRWYDSVLGHRRRHRGRRTGESRNVYVDVYDARDLILVAVVFVLNVVDAVLTLRALDRGAIEQNPLMDGLIRFGTGWFLLEKVLVVGLCMGALLVHKNFPIARCAAYTLLVAYGLLTIQHIRIL